MYITLNTLIFAFKIGSYAHSVHMLWCTYSYGKQTFVRCKNIMTFNKQSNDTLLLK